MPKVVEEDVFNMIFPVEFTVMHISLHDTIGALVEGVNGHLKKQESELLQIIRKQEGLKTSQLAELSGYIAKSVERYLKVLKNLGLIQFIGALKTGGYHLTAKGEQISP